MCLSHLALPVMKLLKIPKFLKKKRVLFIAIMVIVMILGVFVLSEMWFGEKKNPIPAGIILFEGDDCPQCGRVDKYITDNKIEEKVIFTRLEVFNNDTNINLLEDKAQTCGLDPAHIGVPFLWDGEHCILGYIDVIEFFRQKILKK